MIGAVGKACLWFAIDCETVVKGGLTVVMGFLLFIGSVLLLLSAVFGRRMGYLVLAISFFAWMTLLSVIWTFGFYSQGPTTPTNLGPRGSEPAWVPLQAGTGFSSYEYPQFNRYPGNPWFAPGTDPDEELSASIQSATSAITTYLTDQANLELGITDVDSPEAVKTTDFTVQDLRFTTTDDGASLMAARAFFNGGGPIITVYGYHDTGSVPRYSWMFLIASLVGFAVHLPFLDRAERRRKEFLTGGAAPPWFGPA